MTSSNKTPDTSAASLLAKDLAASSPAVLPTGVALSEAQHSQLETAVVVAQGILPLLPPNAAALLGVGIGIFQAIQNASASGADVSDDELMALFSEDQAAYLADVAARAKGP